MSLADSCANKFLSRHKNDFTKIRFDRPISITGCGGISKGFIGDLVSNICHLKKGIYFPSLPKDLDRILPWLGDDGLKAGGWEMLFLTDAGSLVNVFSGETLELKYNKDIQLPVLGQSWRSVKAGSACFWLSGHEVPALCFPAKSSHANLLLNHRRCGHFHIPGVVVNCPECSRVKGQSASHAKVKVSDTVQAPCRTLAFDFSGRVRPESLDRKNLVLVLICTSTKMVWIKPLNHKGQVVEALEDTIKGIRADYSISMDEKLVHFVRHDNEPACGSRALANVYQSLRVQDTPIVPHNQAQNGHCERFMRTLFDSIKCLMANVDSRCWSYCSVYSGDVWIRLPHTYSALPEHNGKSPIAILEERTGRNSSKRGTEMLRRFGCLVYFRDKGPKTKLLAKWRRGIFLGLCPKSSAWLVGGWATDVHGTEVWGEYSTIDVKFRESVLVGNIDDLKSKSQGIFMHYDKLDALESGESILDLPIFYLI